MMADNNCWPESLGVPDPWFDRANDIAAAIREGDSNLFSKFDIEIYDTGEGRTVFDITKETRLPTVLRIAHNESGIRETRKEVHGRDQIPDPLQERCVPIIHHGGDYRWSFQPKCDPIPVGKRTEAVETISELARKARQDNGVVYDTREVYAENIGYWNDKAAIYDYGGVLPQTTF